MEVHATRAEIQRFAEQGFLVRERLLDPAHTARLRAALDEVAAAELGMGATISWAKHWAEMHRIMVSEMNAAREGKKSVKEAASEIRRQVNVLLSQG